MRPAAYLAASVAMLLLTVAATAAYHYRADRWGVFANDYQWFHEHILINKLYLKTSFLTRTTHGYDCYVFGSSRVAALDVRLLDDSCYNFTHSGGVLTDHLRAVEQLLDAGMPVSKVYIALDDLSYNVDPGVANLQHMRHPYPRSLGEYVDALSLFLLKPVDVTDLALVTGKTPKLEVPRFIRDPNLDTDRIREKYQTFYDNPVQMDVRFRRLRGLPEGDEYHGAAAVGALLALKSLADQHGFELSGFFLPLHYKTYLTRNYPWYLDFKTEIAELISFRDFTGLNRFTTDNRYWRETSHFSAAVGDQLLGMVLNASAAPREGYGRWVTRGAVEQLESEQLRLDASYLPSLARREGLMWVPLRFVDYWTTNGDLETVKLARLEGRGRIPINEDTRISIERKVGGERPSRSGGVVANLQEGDYFIIHYELVSDRRRMLSFRLTQDPGDYGGKVREFNARIEPGLNQGSLLAYASVPRPKLRVSVGGGNAVIDWSALKAYKLDYAAPNGSI